MCAFLCDLCFYVVNTLTSFANTLRPLRYWNGVREFRDSVALQNISR